MDRQQIGKRAEDIVAKVLVKHGFIILDRNYFKSNCGEIDIVAGRYDDIFMVEVKSRLSNSGYQTPSGAIDSKKKRRLIKTAGFYIREKKLYDKNVRFLAGCVTHNRDGMIQNVEIIPF